MRPAVIVVDMLNDNVHGPGASVMKPQAMKIVPSINRLLATAHGQGWPVFLACDSFLEQDFIFRGKMKPHALRGTEGSLPIPELDMAESDRYLPKRRFSAFFKTDLDQTLRTLGVDTVAVTGIATNFCVLATAFDSVCLDFNTVIVEDCCAAAKDEWHEATLSCFRRNVLEPIFRVMMLDDFLAEAEVG